MNDNAAARENFVSYIYSHGISYQKADIMQRLPTEFANLHRDGYIHIHDLEAYGSVYNCSVPDINSYIGSKQFLSGTDAGKIFELFSHYKLLITQLGAVQSGGIGFANFDQEISDFYKKLNIRFCKANVAITQDAVSEFIFWLNTVKTRYNREPYYVSLNLGLAISDWGRAITFSVLKHYANMPAHFTRPNIIFKVNKNINSGEKSKNFDLYTKALKTSASRMIPTYLLLDSASNKDCAPFDIAIMGCRTRVYSNTNGADGSRGRGNIAYVSMNLPRLALECDNLPDFMLKLYNMMENVAKLLELRALELLESKMLSFIFQEKIWRNVSNCKQLVEQGTLSIGFIGLSESVELLSGSKMHSDAYAYSLGMKIVRSMRDFVDKKRFEKCLNYSLLATPGEMVSGRFCEIDKKLFNHRIQEKMFYTNSFHMDVDSNIPLLKKIELEGPFHKECNGGAITYVEFNEAPLGNAQALDDAIQWATRNSVSYFGINYPLDICNSCGFFGTFDKCPVCSSLSLTRIRRVSGYLEDVSFFTPGKKAEERNRCPNI